MLDHKGISDLWTRSAPPHFSDLMPDLKQSAWQCHLSEKKKKKWKLNKMSLLRSIYSFWKTGSCWVSVGYRSFKYTGKGCGYKSPKIPEFNFELSTSGSLYTKVFGLEAWHLKTKNKCFHLRRWIQSFLLNETPWEQWIWVKAEGNNSFSFHIFQSHQELNFELSSCPLLPVVLEVVI